MTDLPGRLRVMARLTVRDDDADTAAEAAREIERLRLTDVEREAIAAAIVYLQPVGNYDSRVQDTLRKMLERLK